MRALLKKLETAFGSAVQIRSFGGSEGLIVEIDPKLIIEICAWVRMEESFRLDFLETLSVFESRGKLHFTLFLRSLPIGHFIAMRTSLETPADTAHLNFPSLSRIWPQAIAYENELSPLFGIRFIDAVPAKVLKNYGEFTGFPLRKSYTWGRQVEP